MNAALHILRWAAYHVGFHVRPSVGCCPARITYHTTDSNDERKAA